MGAFEWNELHGLFPLHLDIFRPQVLPNMDIESDLIIRQLLFHD